MGLPKIDMPLFEAKLVSLEDKVKYRPFTVKEEKILLIAQEADEINQVILAIKQIVGNCCIDIDVDELPMFDLEYLLLQIRAKSVNNVINFTIKDPDTDKPVEIELDVDDIKLKMDEDHSKEIHINDDAYLIMRYPRIEQVKSFADNTQSQVNNVFNVMTSCIETVVDGDSVYDLKDFSEEEVMNFIDSFPSTTVEGIRKFFDTIPVLTTKTKYTNADGDEKEVVLEGMETFFI
tara:strand:- start:173 stop:874 length:702 start_codon:yes stop_codon:yes gene_type:complete